MKLKRTSVLSLLSLATAGCWVAAAPGPGAVALQVSLRITETCTVTAGAGASAAPSTAADAAGSGIRAQCSRKTPYSITLRSRTDAAKPEGGGAAALLQGATGASASSVDHAETVTVSVDY